MVPSVGCTSAVRCAGESVERAASDTKRRGRRESPGARPAERPRGRHRSRRRTSHSRLASPLPISYQPARRRIRTRCARNRAKAVRMAPNWGWVVWIRW